ncbi:putative glycoside hydrolase [Thermomicrobium roseum]|uniref:DUF4015 domain-containing protein n=1 Tax=Thermomicrobium roseum (strain ATCC 27502 / DSM 5159 / P-2) TaxID=309801 RepID=B9L022_THERP|nr:putative glycoside hydrolase [Thermomicrobium roseum]ACM05326.1 conserved hypothetical protein [Thermomicrobium roseum DSM 5159]
MFPSRTRVRPRRLERRLPWPVSLAGLLIPLVLSVLTAAYVLWFRDDRTEVVVVDRVTGTPIAGAVIETDGAALQTDRTGRARLSVRAQETIRVSAPDHDAVLLKLDQERVRRVRIELRPNVVTGSVTRSGDGAPIAGATVRAVKAGATIVTAESDTRGQYLLRGVPEGAEIRIEHPDYAPMVVMLANDQTRLDAVLRPDVVLGIVRDTTGRPVRALVAAARGWVETGEDGSFRLKGVSVGDQVFVKAPGFRAAVLTVPENFRLDVSLEPIVIRAIYINALVAAKPESLEKRLQLVDRTELNAVVIDLKDSTGQVYYDTRVELARDIGAVRPILDPAKLVKDLKARGIYTIARIVVFEDPILAEARPEWAIKDQTTGQAWRTWNGLAWVNAYRQEVWNYNIALAVEAAAMGFDEIQLDYIRFPTDGPLQKADYGVAHTAENRTAAIGAFLRSAHEALLPTPAYLAADIFGLTMWELGDSGIGQNLEAVAGVVDYVCPMLYPSHFWSGSLGYELPNDHPYEVMRYSLENGLKRVPEARAKFRPWLQDFSYGRGKPYGPDEVRAQIRAVYDAGLSSWMLWNADSVYQEAALETSG